MPSPRTPVYIWPAVDVHLHFSTPHPSTCATTTMVRGVHDNNAVLRTALPLPARRSTITMFICTKTWSNTRYASCTMTTIKLPSVTSDADKDDATRRHSRILRTRSYPAILPVEERGVKTPSCEQGRTARLRRWI